MADRLDLGKLARILGMLGSDHGGERANAAELADRMIHDAGMTWSDFIGAARRADEATEAARQLLLENDALRAAAAEAAANGGAPWLDIGAAIGNHRRAAAWMLDLGNHGTIWLSQFATSFLGRCTTWSGNLTARMQPVFDSILTRVIDRTALRPPP
jgi:hypothetical protein